MKKHTLLLLMAATVLLAVGCKKDQIDILTLTSTDISVSSKGITQPLSFNASAAWTISSTETWITFDAKSGKAGDVTVNMTVAPNTTFEQRTASVSIKMGKKTTKINVVQKQLDSFTSEIVYEIDAKAQVVEFAMTANIDYAFTIEASAGTWISEVDTKAAPSQTSKKFSVTANSGLTPRSGKIAVTAGDAVFCIVVKQKAEFNNLSTATAACYGRSTKIYSSNDYSYKKFNEYTITLTDAGNDLKVILAINQAESASDIAVIPVGTYLVDATGSHAENTFSIKPLDNSEKIYTVITEGANQTIVEDGEITIAKEGNTYTITAVLVDNHENQHRYSYIGEIATVEDKTFGGHLNELFFKGQYNTYFTTKANEWNITMLISKAPASGALNINYVSLTLFGATGENDGKTLPTGTFNFAAEEKSTTLTYNNGITMYNTGDMYLTAYTDDGDKSWNAKTGSMVTITKNSDGTYKYEYDLVLENIKYVYDDGGTLLETITTPGTYKATVDNVPVYVDVDTSTYMKPMPDGNIVAASIMSSNAVGLYFGDYEKLTAAGLTWVENTSLVVLGLSNINTNYTAYLALNAENWIFTKNFSSRYCNTPLPLTTYTFSNAAAASALLPIKNNGNPYCYVTNGYTGTKMKVTGGSVTLSSTSITYNLELTAPDNTQYTMTGSHAYNFYYARDLSSNAPKIAL